MLAAALAAPLGAQVACDSLPSGVRFAALRYEHPLVGDAAGGEVGGHRRHEVLAPRAAAAVPTRARGRATGGRLAGGAPGRAVVKDRPDVAVRKDGTGGAPVRKDEGERTAFCPQLTAMLSGGGGTPTPDAGYTATDNAPGDVVPSSPLPGSLVHPRGGWFNVPSVLGGLLLGGTAIALGHGSGHDTPGALVTPTTPTAPTTPTTPASPPPPTAPTTPTAPAQPAPPVTPTDPAPVTPGIFVPEPPAEPPAEPPVAPTVTPEPASIAMVAMGVGVLAVGRRRRRR